MTGRDGIRRCSWCLASDLYRAYHDDEWGIPCYDDRKLFEFLILEGAQAGLSWYTILQKREGYRSAFAAFDPEQVALFDNDRIAQLAQDTGIVRNRAKIRSAVKNAACFLAVQREFGSFSEYLWSFVGGKPIMGFLHEGDSAPVASAESTSLSSDMRRRGFTFVGPVVCYAYMQAMGLINDHYLECWRRNT